MYHKSFGSDAAASRDLNLICDDLYQMFSMWNTPLGRISMDSVIFK